MLSFEDVALGYKGAWIIESCFRRMKQSGHEVRPMFHWTARRIEAHVKLCVLALQMQRAAEIRCALPWARIAHALDCRKAVRYRTESRVIVQRTRIGSEPAELLKKFGVSTPKLVLSVTEAADTRKIPRHTPRICPVQDAKNQKNSRRLPRDREHRPEGLLPMGVKQLPPIFARSKSPVSQLAEAGLQMGPCEAT